MKKLITLLTMFFLMAGNAKAGIEEYPNIAKPLKSGKLKIFIAIDFSENPDPLILGVESRPIILGTEKKLVYYIKKEAKKYKIVVGTLEKMKTVYSSRQKNFLQYVLHLRTTSTQRPNEEPIVAINIATSLIWDNTPMIPYLDKSNKKRYKEAVAYCKEVYQTNIKMSHTVFFYKNKKNLVSIAKLFIKTILEEANYDFKIYVDYS